jgi:hypothetical protein
MGIVKKPETGLVFTGDEVYAACEGFRQTKDLRWHEGRLQQLWAGDKGSEDWKDIPGKEEERADDNKNPG